MHGTRIPSFPGLLKTLLAMDTFNNQMKAMDPFPISGSKFKGFMNLLKLWTSVKNPPGKNSLLCLGQDFSTITLLTFQAGVFFFFWSAVLCLVECLVSSLSSTHEVTMANSPSSGDNTKYLQIFPNVSCRAKLLPIGNHFSSSFLSSKFLCCDFFTLLQFYLFSYKLYELLESTWTSPFSFL